MSGVRRRPSETSVFVGTISCVGQNRRFAGRRLKAGVEDDVHAGPSQDSWAKSARLSFISGRCGPAKNQNDTNYLRVDAA